MTSCSWFRHRYHAGNRRLAIAGRPIRAGHPAHARRNADSFVRRNRIAARIVTRVRPFVRFRSGRSHDFRPDAVACDDFESFETGVFQHAGQLLPRQGRIALRVNPSQAAEFALKLRIPYWSGDSQVQVNGERVNGVEAGSYLKIDRKWKCGDRVEIELDMSLHYWAGEEECGGRASIYRGPILLTYDRRLNEMDPEKIPVLDAKGLTGDLVDGEGWLPTIVNLELAGKDGGKVRLCDFASAGEGGTPYVSWLKVDGVSMTPFSRENPLRSGRV